MKITTKSLSGSEVNFTPYSRYPSDLIITLQRLFSLADGKKNTMYTDLSDYKSKNGIINLHLTCNTFGPVLFYTSTTHSNSLVYLTHFADRNKKVEEKNEIIAIAEIFANLLDVKLTLSQSFLDCFDNSYYGVAHVEKTPYNTYAEKLYKCGFTAWILSTYVMWRSI